MNLQELREYCANVLDYSPTNTNYTNQLDRILNDAYDRITQEKPWTFMNKTVDLIAKPDLDAVITVSTTPSINIDHAGTIPFDGSVDGETIKIDGREYTIAFCRSPILCVLTEECTAALGTYDAVIIYRYLNIPQDCSSILGLARREDALAPDSPGCLTPISRYEDEWHNLPLGEINLPRFWIPADPVHIATLRSSGVYSAAVTVGAGIRTFEVCMVNEWGGRQSGLSNPTTLTQTDLQELQVNADAVPQSTGYYRAVYLRAPLLGLKAWRRLTDATYGSQIFPAGLPIMTYDTSLTTLTSSEFFLGAERWNYSSGMSERIRLYPRQDKEYNFQLRYFRRAAPMLEDTDVPLIPPAHRIIIAYRALETLLFKHDNQVQSEMYRRKAADELLKMERRYLTSTANRIVKGDMPIGSLLNIPFNQFGRLTHS